MVTPIPMLIDFGPVENRRRFAPPHDALRTSVPDLCARAKIAVNATTDREIYVYRGHRKIRTPDRDLVGIHVDPHTRLGALRALEALAYCFFDPCARYCVCGRGLFVARRDPRVAGCPVRRRSPRR
jgi:hypothetical protein